MAGRWHSRIGRSRENSTSSSKIIPHQVKSGSHCPDRVGAQNFIDQCTKFAAVALGSQPRPRRCGSLATGVTLVQSIAPNHFTETEQIMFPNIEIAADRRFLEFNVGDWSMLLGGFMLAGLLVWLM
jgi:hypothetical protein